MSAPIPKIAQPLERGWLQTVCNQVERTEPIPDCYEVSFKRIEAQKKRIVALEAQVKALREALEQADRVLCTIQPDQNQPYAHIAQDMILISLQKIRVALAATEEKP